MDINMSSVFVTFCQAILTVCQEGQTELPAALNKKEYPALKRFKAQKDEAVLKWQENEKRVINFSASVSSLSQNPGKLARLHFKPHVWAELVKVLPDCEAKSRMMIFYNKFIEVRKLYKGRQVTLEQRQRLSVLADEMETYVLTSLKFISYTCQFHGITQHMPGYFIDERGTGNIFYLSSGSLEASNKTQRFSILCRTYRGEMMSGSLVYSFLRSSIQF